jgi:colicin import membrane protein
MSDRRENSVLFSLRELRSIEEDRVKQEVDAEQARIEAERRAREEEIRRAKEAEEATIRAAEDAVRREREEKERAEREAQLRLQESERRAQIEAATRLEQSRIEAEARAKMEGKKFPTGTVVGVVAGIILLVGGTFGYLIYQKDIEHKREAAQLAAQAAAKEKALIAEKEAAQRKAEAQQRELEAQLAKATTDAERAVIRARMNDQARPHSSGSASKGDSGKAAPKTKIKASGADPLQGLDL